MAGHRWIGRRDANLAQGRVLKQERWNEEGNRREIFFALIGHRKLTTRRLIANSEEIQIADAATISFKETAFKPKNCIPRVNSSCPSGNFVS